jgi:pantoate--beta-alanine ligase
MNQPFHHTDLALLTVSHAAKLQEMIARWKKEKLKIGFVPTMGALHDGHLSLVKLVLDKSDRVVVSIFVNPAQFAPHEDFDSYPREETKDLAKLQRASAHLVYLPGEKEIYPLGRESNMKAGEAAKGLESDFRPHFFDGVVNVVYRLFSQVQPDIAVFGEKDFQQLQVITEMVAAQKLPIEIIGAPIVRDAEGLALSSRNAYLSKDQLQIARQFNKILHEVSLSLSSRWHANEESISTNGIYGIQKAQPSANMDPGLRRDDDEILEQAKQALLNAGFDKVDYVTQRWNRILAAAWIGKTRLIDNLQI